MAEAMEGYGVRYPNGPVHRRVPIRLETSSHLTGGAEVRVKSGDTLYIEEKKDEGAYTARYFKELAQGMHPNTSVRVALQKQGRGVVGGLWERLASSSERRMRRVCRVQGVAVWPVRSCARCRASAI